MIIAASPPDICNSQIWFIPVESVLINAIDEPFGENLGLASELPLVKARGAESGDFKFLIQRELFKFPDVTSGFVIPKTTELPSGEIETPVGFAIS